MKGHHGRGRNHGMSKEEMEKKWADWYEWYFGTEPTGKPPGREGSRWEWENKDPAWYDSFMKDFVEEDDNDNNGKYIAGAVIGAILLLIVIAVVITICCYKKKHNVKQVRKVKVTPTVVPVPHVVKKQATADSNPVKQHPKYIEAISHTPYEYPPFYPPVGEVEKGFGIPENPRDQLPMYSPPPAYHI